MDTTMNLSDNAATGLDATNNHTGNQPVHAIGQGAMWVFIIGDLFIFAGWFVFYLVYRAFEPALFFEAQATLNQTLGMLNTLVLLISSWWMALCINSARAGRYQTAERFAWLTILGGLVFGAIKISEWFVGIGEGHTLTSNYFFMFYYFLTAVHMFHVLCGMVVLGVLVRHLRTPALRSQVVIENCGAYWHMVDVLWVVIFALLYLMR